MRCARDCFYIGALGSRKTHAKRVERLKAQGVRDADIARIHAPIGLDIGAVSPAEIAVAIMAEITARLRHAEESGKSRRHEVRPASPDDALGGVTVHTMRQGALVLKKGTVIGPDEVAALKGAGVEGDRRGAARGRRCLGGRGGGEIAQAMAGEGVTVERAFTGRCNLFAAQAGVLVVDRATRSTASTASTKRSPLRRCRPSSRWSKAR